MRKAAALIILAGLTVSANARELADHKAGDALAAFELMERHDGPGVDRPALPTPKSTPAAAEPAAPASVNTGKLHFTLGLDVTNAYFYRGIVQETDGVIFQPYAALAVDLLKNEDLTLQANFFTWDSLHTKGTHAAVDDSTMKRWYEEDVQVGFTAIVDKWTFTLNYLWPASPSGAFETTDDVNASIAYDDSDLLGDFALHPAAFFAVESAGVPADGVHPAGAYAQLSVAPGLAQELGPLGKVQFSFPVILGLSLSNYYQDADGKNDTFGYLSFGAKAAVPLKLPDGYGDWTLNAGVAGLFLGDHMKTLNENDSFEVIFTVGLAASY